MKMAVEEVTGGGGSRMWWGKDILFLSFEGLIVLCSSVDHHWCLPVLCLSQRCGDVCWWASLVHCYVHGWIVWVRIVSEACWKLLLLGYPVETSPIYQHDDGCRLVSPWIDLKGVRKKLVSFTSTGRVPRLCLFISQTQCSLSALAALLVLLSKDMYQVTVVFLGITLTAPLW